MKGISKKRLLSVKESFKNDSSYSQHDKDTLINLLDALISYSEELNPWLPIDENAPKDRPLLLFTEDLGQVKGHWSNYPRSPHISNWQTENGIVIHPTHYQELPPDPIDTSIKK